MRWPFEVVLDEQQRHHVVQLTLWGSSEVMDGSQWSAVNVWRDIRVVVFGCFDVVNSAVCCHVSDSSEEHSWAAHVLGAAKSPLSLQVWPSRLASRTRACVRANVDAVNNWLVSSFIGACGLSYSHIFRVNFWYLLFFVMLMNTENRKFRMPFFWKVQAQFWAEICPYR